MNGDTKAQNVGSLYDPNIFARFWFLMAHHNNEGHRNMTMHERSSSSDLLQSDGYKAIWTKSSQQKLKQWWGFKQRCKWWYCKHIDSFHQQEKSALCTSVLIKTGTDSEEGGGIRMRNFHKLHAVYLLDTDVEVNSVVAVVAGSDVVVVSSIVDAIDVGAIDRLTWRINQFIRSFHGIYEKEKFEMMTLMLEHILYHKWYQALYSSRRPNQ